MTRHKDGIQRRIITAVYVPVFFPFRRAELAEAKKRAKTYKERKKHDRFDGMPEEEVSKRVLPDHLTNNLDIIIVSPHNYRALLLGPIEREKRGDSVFVLSTVFSRAPKKHVRKRRVRSCTRKKIRERDSVSAKDRLVLPGDRANIQ